jgi:hypothetical protein
VLLARSDLGSVFEVALGKQKRANGYGYFEAQIHGPVEFARDFDALVIHKTFAGTPYEAKMRAFAAKHGLKVLWHDDNQVTTDSGEVVP